MTVEELSNILSTLPRNMEIGIRCEGYLIRNPKIGKAFVNGQHLRTETYNPSISLIKNTNGEN